MILLSYKTEGLSDISTIIKKCISVCLFLILIAYLCTLILNNRSGDAGSIFVG